MVSMKLRPRQAPFSRSTGSRARIRRNFAEVPVLGRRVMAS